MITVYTKPNCMACEMTKRFLDEAGAKYETSEVTMHDLKLFEAMGYKSLPIVRLGEVTKFSGFQPDKLEELVKIDTTTE